MEFEWKLSVETVLRCISTFRGFNLSGLYSRSLLKSGRPALQLFQACPCTESGLQWMVSFKNENIEIIAPATWIASVFIGKANLMLSGRVFVFFSESWVSLSVWPGLPVSMRRKIQVTENDKKFLFSSKTYTPNERSPLPLAPFSFMDHCWST